MRKITTRLLALALTFLFLTAMTMPTLAAADLGEDSVTLNDEFDIMTFNIRTDVDGGERAWSYRGPFLMDYIREQGADVVCLQEVKRSQFNSIKANLSDRYQMVYYERDAAADPEGLAILFTYEFELVESEVFWLSETPDVMSKGWDADYHRICVRALLCSCYGAYLNVFNTHLEWAGETARNKGIELIMHRAQAFDYPTVICGDFNAVQGSDTYNIISGSFFDAAKYAPKTDSGWTAHDWGLFDPEWSRPIDFIFTSDDLRAQKYDILEDSIREGVYYSDHYAVTSEHEYSYVLEFIK
jgi:endonuclease/exonuclease/phosphatase family metal-dependent hydrolase